MIAPGAPAPTLVFPRLVEAPTSTGPSGSVPQAPPEAPEALPTPDDPAGGSGGAAGSSITTFAGRVLALGLEGERPLAGATVSTRDDRRATTDATGRFRLEGGWPADGAILVSHPAYMASAIVGLPPEREVTLHVREPYQVLGYEPPPDVPPYAVTGQVEDASGQPVAEALVFLQRRGATSSPALTDADGRFTLQIVSRENTLEDAAIVAVRYDGEPAIGFASGLRLTAGAEIDFGAPGGAAEALALDPAPHRVEIEVGNAPAGLTPTVSLDMVLPDQSRLTLYSRGDEIRLAPVEGARYALQIEAADFARGLRTELRRDAVDIDFSQPETRLAESLLSPPQLTTPIDLAPGATLAWEAVAGAKGYHVQLDSLAGQRRHWEAFTLGSSLPVLIEAPLPGGEFRLAVTAWDAAGLAPRQIASAGPRALRLMPADGDYKRATREIRLTR